MANALKLGKKQRLKSRKQIDALFAEGLSFPIFPLRVIYIKTQHSTEGVLQIGVSVSKRSFKKAVDRNRIKRLMREAYRLNKAALEQQVRSEKTQLFVFFIYLDKVLPTFEVISESMKKAILKLEKIVTK